MPPEILILLAAGVVFMWFASRKTRRQQREVLDFRSSLEVGTEVMTASGYVGTIVALDDEVVTLESTPGSSSRWVRAAIAKPFVAAAQEDEDDDSDSASDDVEVPDDASSLTGESGEENTSK